jgi:glucosylceramidase
MTPERSATLWTIVLLAFAANHAVAVDVWITTGDKSQLLTQRPDIVFQPGSGTGGLAIHVNPAATFQTISGFGAAMTDSSAWLLQNELNTAQRDKLMRQIFSREAGIGVNYLRVPMGASDFTASGYYTYNDNPSGGSDDLQQQFSIAHDQAYITPRLRQALQINPDLKLMASPWTAPAWMKTNNSLLGGSLAPQWEASYARYFVKFIQAYAAEGLPIDAITLQNEPLHTANYPTMSMSAAQQTNFIKNHLGPRFASEGIQTKVLAYDHNWDNTAYPIQVLDDPIARQYVAGSAFHAYAGDVTAQTTVHNAHPDKDIYFTEISGGDWATDFGDNLVWTFQNVIIGGTRNWAKTALLWNLTLNQNYGPHQEGCPNCRGVVTINDVTGAVTFNEEFYSLGQVTRAVQPNAIRIDSTSSPTLQTVAFLNPDGSQSVVALNPTTAATAIRIVQGGQHVNYEIPAKSVVSFRWNATGADFDNGGFDDGGFHQGGGSLDTWNVFGNAIGNVSAADEAVLTGDRSLKLYGQFSGIANSSGVAQGISVSAGEQVHASLSALVRSADSIAGTDNVAQMKIEFYSQYGALSGSASFLGEAHKTIADGNSPNNVWIEHQVAGIAPPGAVEARLVIEFLQTNNHAGAVHIDRAAVQASDALSNIGDYNHDGVVNPQDYGVWSASFGSQHSLNADGNGNGMIDAADYVLWRSGLNIGGANRLQWISLPEPSGLLMATGLLIAMSGRPPR